MSARKASVTNATTKMTVEKVISMLEKLASEVPDWPFWSTRNLGCYTRMLRQQQDEADRLAEVLDSLEGVWRAYPDGSVRMIRNGTQWIVRASGTDGIGCLRTTARLSRRSDWIASDHAEYHGEFASLDAAMAAANGVRT